MARNTDDVDGVQRRTRRYWYEDGLTEIAAGSILILVGLLFFIEALAPPGMLPGSFSAVGLPVLIIVGVWVAGRVVRAVKERITYPRTGYVAYRRPSGAYRIVTVLVAVVTAGLVTILLRSWPASEAWTPAMEGVSVSVFMLYLAHTLGLARFFLLALFSAVAGIAASLGGLGESLGTAVYFSATGAALVVSGGLTLRAYLSHAGPPTEG